MSTEAEKQGVENLPAKIAREAVEERKRLGAEPVPSEVLDYERVEPSKAKKATAKKAVKK